MKGLTMAIVAVFAAVSLAAGNKCNYDRAILNFEKRMDMVGTMKGAKVSKELATDPDESSRIQKYSKPIKSGQYMGLRQYAVYGFLGCNLHMVRMGKINPKTDETAAEATVYLREDGSMKASCKGKGRVLRVNVLNSSMRLGNYELEPNPECICYDSNNLERKPGKNTGCAEADDYDNNAVTLSTEYLDFVNPEEKKVDNSGSKVLFDDKESYFSDRSTGTRTPKNVFTTVKKNLKKLSALSDDGVSGSLTLLVKIAQDGEVTSAMTASSTLDDNSVGNRMKDEVSSWNFGKSGSGDVMVYLIFKVNPQK